MSARTIGLSLHPRNDLRSSLERIMDWAAQSDTRIVAWAQDAGRAPAGVVVVSDAEFVEQVDGIVSLGAQEVIELRIPISAAHIAVDGLVSGVVGTDRVITIQLREDAGLVVRFDANRHAQRGRVKLSLLDLPLRRTSCSMWCRPNCGSG